VTDPTQLNPELGTAQEFESLVQELKPHEMGLLLDIVPNHMAASSENSWWTDVLENGQSSRYAPYFDIDWRLTKGTVENKLLLPILGGPYGSVLENQELVLGLDEGGFCLRYYQTRLPIQPKSYRAILAYRIDTVKTALGKSHPAFHALVDLIDAVQRLPGKRANDREKAAQRHRDEEGVKQRLWHLYLSHPEMKTFLDDNMRMFNGTKGDPTSFDLLDRLIADQAYRLSFWQVARENMNYRRFFDISDLVCVRVEDPQVFEATHNLILELVKNGKVTGLRADHIDGLYDPLGYFRMLQGRIAPSSSFYVLAEKILVGDETLREEWPVSGTTGYEFAKSVNGVFVDRKGITSLDRIYARFTGSRLAFPDLVYQQKKRVMEQLFGGEVRTLAHGLRLLAEQDRHMCDVPVQTLLQALVEVTACLPVYRTYIREIQVSPQDRPYIEVAVEEAKRRNAHLGTPVFDFLRRVLLLDVPSSFPTEQGEAWLRYVRRWQQFTGPIMAKGLEDTSLYVYNRLVSLNEVGGDPGAQRLSVDAFHQHNAASRAGWPYTLNATSTHDTKRSEDVRARINVLSELPQAWAKGLNRWSRWNRAKKRRVNGKSVPDPNEEILLYQTMIGAWPFRGAEVPAFKERLKAYVVKAAKEAKVHTSWIDPNPDYEHALGAFVDAIFKTSNQDKFLTDFLKFQKRIAFYGAFNALGQVLLKIGSPGVSDFYQGTELWDFSLVDPDNRRPVDFKKRIRLLEDLRRLETEGLLPVVSELLGRWEDGQIKLFITSKALECRRNQSTLFLEGDYVPLYASGRRKEHVCAYARRQGEVWIVVAVPRLLTRLLPQGKLGLGQGVWGTGRLVLPREAPERWQNILTGEMVRATPAFRRKVLPLKTVFQRAPVALLSGGLN
jgi:(1->4)-alpha-D-glucan 1-alpha-D-glucosylmutase